MQTPNMRPILRVINNKKKNATKVFTAVNHGIDCLYISTLPATLPVRSNKKKFTEVLVSQEKWFCLQQIG